MHPHPVGKAKCHQPVDAQVAPAVNEPQCLAQLAEPHSKGARWKALPWKGQSPVVEDPGEGHIPQPLESRE